MYQQMNHMKGQTKCGISTMTDLFELLKFDCILF